MTEREIKQKAAAFKTWFTARIHYAGTYRCAAAELSSGLRFTVERDGKLWRIYKESERKGDYDRIL